MLVVTASLLLLPLRTANTLSGEAIYPDFQTPDQPPGHSEHPRYDLRFEHLTSDDGLSSNRVTSVLQDIRGFMWFGTFDGLNRFDGYEFKVYRHNSLDPYSLNANLVVELIQDQDGYLWVGTSGGGLNRYDPRTEQFTHYVNNPSDPNSLGSNVVFALLQDHEGFLWIGTDGGGLNRYDPESDSFLRYQNDPDDPLSISDNVVQSIFEDTQGTLWVGTNTGGLNRFDRQTGEFTVFRHNPGDPNSLTHNRVSVIYQDQEGKLWIGTRGGLDQFDQGTEYFNHYIHDSGDPNSLSHNFVSDIIEDQEGNLWISTTGGLNRLNRKGRSFDRYLPDPNINFSLSHDSLRRLYMDASGLLWIATVGGGVNKFDPQAKPFSQYCDTLDGSITFASQDVLDIYEDPKGVLWAGTASGLIRYECQDANVRQYIHDANDLQSLSNNLVRAIVPDKDGLLWLGTQGGLNRFDPRSEEFIVYQADTSNPEGLLSDAVWSVHLDPQGMLWVGSALGLNQFDPRTELFTAFYQPDSNDPNSLSGNTVTVINEDQDGDMWIGTLGDGLNRLDRKTGRFTVFRNIPDDIQSLGDNSIYSIFIDSAERLWIGTGAGLDRFDFISGEFVHYGEEQGLPSANIVGILEDDLPAAQGGPNLWISTSTGLYKFNPESGISHHFDSSDGLPGSNFIRDSTFKNSAGKLYFGSSKGISAFYPEQIQNRVFIPPVIVTDFQIANQPLEISAESGLAQTIPETEQLYLSHDDRVISFEFAALDFQAPAKNRYRYMLEGFDDVWTEVGADRRRVTYTNLDPGEYTLRVFGSNSDGVWNEDGTSLGISIAPPWWSTTWFRASVLLLLVSLVYGVFRWRVNFLESSSRELEMIVAEKTYQLDYRVKELDTLLAVSQEITSTLDLEPLLILILDELKKVVDYDVGTIRRLVRGNMEIQAHRWFFPNAGQPSQHLPVANIPIIQEMAQSRQAILVGDHQLSPAIIGDTELYLTKQLTGDVLRASRTLMCVPLIVKGKLIGMLVLGHHQPNYWGDEIKELVQAFANQAAVAIFNAELFERVQDAATLEERTRLSRELHDSATQSLYSATLFCEAGKELAEQGDLESARYYLSRVGEVVHQALKDMRLLVFQLRPSVLEEEGLVGAIQKRLDAVEKRAGMDARLIGDPQLSLPVEVCEALYFIALEALNNIMKHAETDSVTISIRSDRELLTLEVVDAGMGFNIERARDVGGMGLGSMQGRAAQLGGDLTIESNLDQGTSVKVTVPLPQAPTK